MAADVEKEAQPKQKEEPSDFTDIVGGYGPWQRNIFIIFFFTAFPGVWHNMVMAFFAPNLDHWCARPDDVIASNISLERWKLEAIPQEMSDSKEFRYSQCERYDFAFNASLIGKEDDFSLNGTHYKNTTTSCSKWEYDLSFYSSTVLNEWDLVCDREWLVSVTKSVFMAGFLTSVLVFGQLSDKIGRRPVVMMCIVILLASGIICAFSISFIMFTISRFFVAFGASGIFTTGFVILMEIVSAEYRSVFGIAIEFGWCTGYVILPGIAWLVRDWFWLQLAITLPCLALISLWWLIPESPRWLLANGRLEKAQKVLTQAAEKNGKEVRDMDSALKKLCTKANKEQTGSGRGGNMLDLVRTPGLWQKTLNVYFNWFVNSFIYYGLSYNTNDLGGDPFINFLISGAVEFPAYVITIFVIKRLGRRVPLMATMVTGGIACVLTVPVPEEMIWLRVTLAMFGKFCITASFGIAYVYTAEIFPTVVRNVGVGTSSMFARFGSILAPFVKELGHATHPAVPLACYGGLSMASGLLVLLLPETNNCKVPDTLEEAANFGRKPKKNHVENGDCHLQDINGDVTHPDGNGESGLIVKEPYLHVSTIPSGEPITTDDSSFTHEDETTSDESAVVPDQSTQLNANPPTESPSAPSSQPSSETIPEESEANPASSSEQPSNSDSSKELASPVADSENPVATECEDQEEGEEEPQQTPL